MQKPDLTKMWETFIKAPTEDDRIRLNLLYNDIRSKICPMISGLIDNDVISWYCFLIHDRNSGVPTSKDDNKAYFHIRFSLKKDTNPEDFLPEYCVMTRKIRPEEAWRIIGEQSEWLLNMLNIHKEDGDISPQQIAQFLHFYANMTQLQIR